MRMDANVSECLGSPERIADAAVAEFRRRENVLSRSRMAAIGTFVLLPLPLLCLCWVVALAALVGIGELGGAWDEEAVTDAGISPTDVLMGYSFFLALLVVPPVGLTAFYARVARRTGRRWLWGLTACLLIAFGAAVPHCSLTFADGAGRDTVIMAVGWPLVNWPFTQACQFVLAFAIGFLVLYRSARRDIIHGLD